MVGTIINVGAIFLGGTIGLLFKKNANPQIGKMILQGFGLFSLIIGIQGVITGSNFLLYLFSIILGLIIGESLKLEDSVNNLANKLKTRVSSGNGENKNFNEGFITTTMLFCVGAMAILGPIESVINNNHDILYIKSALDGVTSFIFASSFGIGVLFSGISVLVYQGLISLFAFFLKDILTTETISAISFLGSMLVMGIGFNLLKITKLKLVNFLPIMFIPIIYQGLLWLIGIIKGVF